MLCSAESIAVPISDVAMLSGLTDMPTFTRMFKRRCGSPREARAVKPFRGRMRRIVGDGLKLIEFASTDVVAVRSPDRCRISSFREMPNFTRMFKRRYGMTPSDAREISRSG